MTPAELRECRRLPEMDRAGFARAPGPAVAEVDRHEGLGRIRADGATRHVPADLALAVARLPVAGDMAGGRGPAHGSKRSAWALTTPWHSQAAASRAARSRTSMSPLA